MPLAHPPGHAQSVGEAIGVIGGVERKVPLALLTCLTQTPVCGRLSGRDDGSHLRPPYSDDTVSAAFRSQFRTDNTKIAVARILGDGKRQRTRVFTELQSHCLFEDRFGRPRHGNASAKWISAMSDGTTSFRSRCSKARGVERPSDGLLPPSNEGLSRPCRRSPRGSSAILPRFGGPCRLRLDLRRLREGRDEGLLADAGTLPAHRLSVPTSYGHRDVLVRGYVHDVVISCGAEVIATHPRSYEREDFVFEPLHYLALIKQKIIAPRPGCADGGWQLPEEFMTLRRLLGSLVG